MPNDITPTMDTFQGNTPSLDSTGSVADIRYKVRTVDKTAAYSCTRADSGTHFTQSGGPVVFTLPAVADSAGCEYWFASLAGVNDDLTITAPAGTMVAFHNTAATSIALDQNAMVLGAIIHVVCTGTKWISGVEVGNILQVITVS